MSRLTPYLLILLALALQLAYLHELHTLFPDQFVHAPFCGVDAEAHVERAIGLLNGTKPGQEPFDFIPLYPLYLATLRALVGESLFVPIYIQAIFQLLGIAAIYRLGKLTFSPLAGNLAALGLATYNYYIYYTPCFDQTLLTTPFLTLSLCLFMQYAFKMKSVKRPLAMTSLPLGGNEGGSKLLLFITGITLAIAILSRPTILILLPVFILSLFWSHYATSLKAMLWPIIKDTMWLILPIIIAIAPITWHNYRTSGRFILITDVFGVNLFTGNNPDAQGLDTLAHIPSQPAVLRFRLTLRRIQRGETSYASEVLNYYRQQPADALALNLRKLWFWFGEADLPLVSPFFPLLVSQSRTLSNLPLTWQALAVAAWLSILLVRPRAWPRLTFLWLSYAIFSLFTILFFIQLRFRLPFLPFMVLEAAALMAAAPIWAKEQPRRFILVLLIMLILLPFIHGLNLFILLFIALGWWQPETKTESQSLLCADKVNFVTPYRFSLTILLILYVISAHIWTQAQARATDVSQTIAHYLGPVLAGEVILGQTFTMDCDNFHQIDLTLGIFNDKPRQPVTFYLTSDLNRSQILYQETFDGNSVTDYQRHRFTFPPIAHSNGQKYFFFLASPTSTPENGLTARGYSDTPIDYYPNGRGWVGSLGQLQPMQADFAFTATCDLSPLEKLKAIMP